MKVTINGETIDIIPPQKLTNVEIRAIEKQLGEPMSEWSKGSIGPITGWVWATLKRKNPTIKWDDVVFTVEDIDDEDDGDEQTSATEAAGGAGKAARPGPGSSKTKSRTT